MDSGTFLVEEFVNAISAQLDRVQDALRLKAVNRPLTFALKDFSVDLQVFAEMDNENNVRFRSASPNETGASTLRLSFTTITRPMIEENTISLAATRSPTLDELGLRPEERQSLERLGVRNAAQLQALGRVTGNTTVARYTGISLDRIRQALSLSRPNLHNVAPAPVPSQPSPNPKSPLPFLSPNPGTHRLDGEPGQKVTPGHPPVVAGKPLPSKLEPRDDIPVMRVGRNVSQLRLTGKNLIGMQGLPNVRLNDEALELADIDEDQVTVNLPTSIQSGPLSIELSDGQQFSYHLSVEDAPQLDAADPWVPQRSTGEA